MNIKMKRIFQLYSYSILVFNASKITYLSETPSSYLSNNYIRLNQIKWIIFDNFLPKQCNIHNISEMFDLQMF